ncbi:hypothetical protein GCM10022386_01720 [Flavobacterium cheonhonense]|uniref:Toxin n=1 Tax=Flavobacterium cheonhonense TaxID=706185 RepID=A0ABP7T852_9FLAO|nr:hypothetical protein [Flavobacterium cheonhonense]
MATKAEVDRFLREVREKIAIFDIAFRPRDKNTQALLDLGISPNDRLKYIMGLSSDNYYRGPSHDTHDTSRPDYYEFGIMINGQEVYIKISLGLDNKRVDCMSFHVAEDVITYPLKS